MTKPGEKPILKYKYLNDALAHMKTTYIFRKLLLKALNGIKIVSSICTKQGLGVIYRESWYPKNMKLSKKCLYHQNFIPEHIFFISHLDRLSNYLHFGMLDKPSN